MAAISTIVAAAGLALAGTSFVQGQAARKDAAEAAGRSAEEQRAARSGQRADAATKAAQERRQQIREERVKRARILQSSENTGVGEGSGVAGAVGSLSTQFGTNIGINEGLRASAGMQSDALQSSADFNLAGQLAQQSAANFDAISNIGGSIFSAAGGFGTLVKAAGVGGTGTTTNFSGVDYQATRDN